MPRSSRRPVSQKSVPDKNVTVFRRAIHSVSGIRRGLSKARALVPFSEFPKIVSELGRMQVYKNAFAPTTFPKELSQLPLRTRLDELPVEGELMWCASVLSIFTNELASYVKKRRDFDKIYAEGSTADALMSLHDIESNFGFSLWLISHKIQLLQLDAGLQAQKDYLESIFSEESLSAQATWLAYYFSLRSEENVSYAKIENEIASLGSGELVEYCAHHVLGHDAIKDDSLWIPLNYDEPNSVIDRYETFVTICQQYLSSKIDTVPLELKRALFALRNIGDDRLDSIYSVIGNNFEFGPYPDELRAADNYTVGEYRHVVQSNCDSLELVARSRALGEIGSNGPANSLRDRVIDAMHDALYSPSPTSQSRLTLRKLALVFSKHPIGSQIWGFLNRGHDHIHFDEYSNLDRYVAFNGHIANPWHAAIFSQMANNYKWIKNLFSAYPESPALQLRIAISGDERNAELPIRLPEHRRNAYAGHLAFRAGDMVVAAQKYRLCAENENPYVSMTGNTYLFNALYAAADYTKCLSLLTDKIVSDDNVPLHLPLSALAETCLKDSSLHASVDFAILLQVLAKHVHPRWERELSDVFENVLWAIGVDTPSKISDISCFGSDKRYIYFLRYVCTPRTLDDCTAFNSVDEIEIERISILQNLLKIDVENAQAYLTEIRSVTRDLNVALLLKKVQTSKIYVDEAGIRNAFDASLRDSVLRYKALVNSAPLTYQAEKLSKRIGEMMESQGVSDFKDFKLPASEPEGLFHTMYIDVASQFAYNPAYGLDTHLSTTIRHGAFEGHLRGPLASEGLLCRTRNKEHYLSDLVLKRVGSLDKEDIDHVKKCFIRFTLRIEEFIETYLAKRLRIKGKNFVEGMFDLFVESHSLNDIRSTITTETTFDVIADRLVSHCWSVVDRSMENIRTALLTEGISFANSAFTALQLNLEEKLSRDKIGALLDAMVRARTEFHAAMNAVAEWFRRPTDLIREPFDFDIAAHVALKQIDNCYVDYKMKPAMDIRVDRKLPGKTLDGLCEIIFILFQNVVLHSGLDEEASEILFSTKLENGSLIIETTNTLSELISIEERRTQAKAAEGRYEGDSALKLARREGGSGLSKVWRIAEFDLCRPHSLSLDVSEDRRFTARFAIKNIEIDN